MIPEPPRNHSPECRRPQFTTHYDWLRARGGYDAERCERCAVFAALYDLVVVKR